MLRPLAGNGRKAQRVILQGLQVRNDTPINRRNVNGSAAEEHDHALLRYGSKRYPLEKAYEHRSPSLVGLSGEQRRLPLQTC